MKKLVYFLSCSALLLGIFSSCEKPEPTPSENKNLGEIVCNKTQVGQDQVFRLICPVTQTVYLDHVRFEWTEKDKVMPSHFDVGESSVTPDFVYAGHHTYTLSQTGTTEDGKDYLERRSYELEVIPTDIRNCFWTDSKATCLSNLGRYEIHDFEDRGLSFTFRENNYYHYYKNSGGETVRIGYENGGRRVTHYYFTADSVLSDIEYEAHIAIADDRHMVGDFTKYAHKLQEFQQMKTLTPDYILVAGAVLSEEEERLAHAFAAGRLEADLSGVLAQAVKENRIQLTYRGESETFLFDMVCTYAGTNYIQNQQYQPILLD